MLIERKRLSQLRAKQLEAVMLVNQLRLIGDDCCRILNCDPDADDYESGKAREIVDVQGVDIIDVVSAINQHRANLAFDQSAEEPR